MKTYLPQYTYTTGRVAATNFHDFDLELEEEVFEEEALLLWPIAHNLESSPEHRS